MDWSNWPGIPFMGSRRAKEPDSSMNSVSRLGNTQLQEKSVCVAGVYGLSKLLKAYDELQWPYAKEARNKIHNRVR
jgi:hypothetical protein